MKKFLDLNNNKLIDVDSNTDPWELKTLGVDESKVKYLLNYIGTKKLVLDIGGGYGFYSDILQKNGNKTICTDISKKMLKEGKKMFPKQKFINCNGQELPFNNDLFDAIIVINTTLYVTDRQKLFSEVYRVLKKNGALCFIERNKFSLLDMVVNIKKINNKREFIGDYSDFTSVFEMKYILKKCGFEISYIFGDKFNIPFNLMKRLSYKIGKLMSHFSYCIVIIATKN